MEPSMTDSSDTRTLQLRRDNSGRPSVSETLAEISIPSTEPVPSAAACPRCNGKLTNPESLGWCPSCGYCRSLEEDSKKAALAVAPTLRQPSALGFVELTEALGK